MTEKGKVMSFQMHKEFGMICKILNVRLTRIAVEISNNEKTKKSGHKKVYHYIKANNRLSQLKNHMEEIMFNEYPDEANTGIYYGEHPDDFVEAKNKKGGEK